MRTLILCLGLLVFGAGCDVWHKINYGGIGDAVDDVINDVVQPTPSLDSSDEAALPWIAPQVHS